MKKYLRLFRVKHYIKNIFIFTTLIFGSQLFTSDFYKVLIGFIAFCLLSSSIYIINDLADYEIDKKTKSKKNEPIANNEISKKKAFIISLVLLILSLIINYFTDSIYSYISISIYFVLNIFYSFIGKKIPYLELIIMALFYLLRIFYGAEILNVDVSLVLILTVTFGSLYIVLMKRILELENNKYRKVFKFYNKKVLRILSLISLGFMLSSYVWWIFKEQNFILILTILLIIIIFIRYDKKINNSIDGNPIEILFKDKLLLVLSIIYGILTIVLFEFYL